MSIIGVGAGNGAVAAMRAGQIDAISNLDPVITLLSRSGDLKIISDTRVVAEADRIFGGPMPAGCLYTLQTFIDKNPATAQALANAMVRADKWIRAAGAGDIIKSVPESYLLGDRAVYVDAFLAAKGALSPDGLIPGAGAETARRALASIDPEVANAKLDLAAIWTNDFTKRADAKYAEGLSGNLGMSALRLDSVACTFVSKDDARQRYTAVQDVTLTVGAGEFVSVVGPTGCGKSTLLNVAAGLLQPSSGKVEVFGEALVGINRRARLHVPVGEPDAVAHGARQRRRGPRVSRRRRCVNTRARVAQARRPRRLRRSLSAPAVGRHEEARQPGADAGARPRHHPDGRAVLRARCADAPADGKRSARALGRKRRRPCSSSPTTSTKPSP